MFRAVGFFVCVFVVLAVGDEELTERCNKFKLNVMKCCTSPSRSKITAKPEIKDCLTEHPSLSCDAEICIAKNLGYYRSDGELDMEALTNHVEKDMEDNQELLGLIKNNCFKAELTDVCIYKQVHLCMLKQSIENCQEWSSEGRCEENKIKELTKVCLDNN
ncbi:unnamed protein product [Arctia plantaginis]|uniref:Uncharacterized protein n=1 Tax=Arctia plantaginis TaxID=874455 RepID=A0A8S1BBE6_ARCPL|nr:unnamed protein product [Arctia plantaginis]CAB3255766.1 unnamed protein product [Arctia plantaginis]